MMAVIDSICEKSPWLISIGLFLWNMPWMQFFHFANMRVDDFLLISMNSDLGHLEDLEGGQLQLGNKE